MLENSWTKGWLTFSLLRLMMRTKLRGTGDLCPLKHAITLVTNEPSGNRPTNFGLNPPKKHRVISGMYMCVPDLCVWSERLEKAGDRWVTQRSLPLWVWSWNTANYILIKYDLPVPAPPRPWMTHMCALCETREAAIQDETYA